MCIVTRVPICEVLIHLLADDPLRQRKVNGRQKCLVHLATGLHPLLKHAHPAQAGADVLTKLIDGVKLGCQLGKVIIGLGQDAFPYGGDGRIHRQESIDVLPTLRCEVKCAGLTGRGATHGIVKAGQHAIRAEFIGQGLSRQVFDRRAIGLGSHDVDEEYITIRGGSLNR